MNDYYELENCGTYLSRLSVEICGNKPCIDVDGEYFFELTEKDVDSIVTILTEWKKEDRKK